jgi:hypothetical protein
MEDGKRGHLEGLNRKVNAKSWKGSGSLELNAMFPFCVVHIDSVPRVLATAPGLVRPTIICGDPNRRVIIGNKPEAIDDATFSGPVQ